MNVSSLKSLDMEVMSTAVSGCTPERLCQELLKRGEVQGCEEDIQVNLFHTPNDPSFNGQWGLHKIEAQAAWDYHRGSSGSTVVAISDTGIKLDHPDLKANLWTNKQEIPGNGVDDDFNGIVDDYHGFDPVNNDGQPDDVAGHGTHCAGIVGAVGNNRVGVSGVAHGPKLMGAKICGNGCWTSYAIQMLDYAIFHGAKISSMSRGGRGASSNMMYSIERAKKKGHLFIIAAGNEATDNDKLPTYPCSYANENVICVAASDQNDRLAHFSNYGKKSVDVAAPGVHILSTYTNPAYGHMQGTSMATPFVSGLAALIWDYKPSLSWRDVRNAIVNTADVLPTLNGKVACGRINARKAMEAVASGHIPTTCGGSYPRPAPTPAPTPPPRRCAPAAKEWSPASSCSQLHIWTEVFCRL